MKKIRQFLIRLFASFRTQKSNQPVVSAPTPPLSPTPRLRLLPPGDTASKEAKLLEQMRGFLENTYEFRFNRMNEVTEYRRKSGTEPYRTIGQRELNSFCLEAHRRDIPCWDRDISRFIHSLRTSAYHPFHLYMNELPEWDGTDRIETLARRISDLPLWIESFHRWLLGLVCQWSGHDNLHANSVAPILISRRQGMGKSTFCRLLAPPPLRHYYTDSFNLDSVTGAEQKLTIFGLINIDEFDKLSPAKMALLKNLMQMAGLNIRRAYKKNYSPLPRVASFIATSNRVDLLTDTTGSRRFLCMEITNPIDCSPIEHVQLYAQLKAELAVGARTWFTAEEEDAINRHNIAFRKTNTEEDLFLSCFRCPAPGEEGILLSIVEIANQLKKQYPGMMAQITTTQLSHVILSIGIQRYHTQIGNRYRVIRIREE